MEGRLGEDIPRLIAFLEATGERFTLSYDATGRWEVSIGSGVVEVFDDPTAGGAIEKAVDTFRVRVAKRRDAAQKALDALNS